MKEKLSQDFDCIFLEICGINVFNIKYLNNNIYSSLNIIKS